MSEPRIFRNSRDNGGLSRGKFFFKGGYHFGLTTPGWFFFLLLTLIMGAAITSGHNLLYLSVCLFFGAFITMGNAAVMNLRGLDVTRKEPEFVFADTPQPVQVRVKNRRRIMDSFSLEIQEIPSRNDKPAGRVFFSLVEKGKEAERHYDLVLPRRGWHELTGLEIITRFPFGFWERSRSISIPCRLLVFPKLFDNWHQDPTHLAVEGEFSGKRLGTGDDLLNFRTFQPGDPVRWIHWKNSAKTDRLTVAIFHHPQNRQIIISLRTTYPLHWHPTSKSAEGSPQRDGNLQAHFEEAVSWAATAIVRLVDRGISVAYRDETGQIPVGCGEGHKIRIMTHLALIQLTRIAVNAGEHLELDRLSEETIRIEATPTGVRIRSAQVDSLFEDLNHA
jgi:uncharacterized protein (DUF58 family)